MCMTDEIVQAIALYQLHPHKQGHGGAQVMDPPGTFHNASPAGTVRYQPLAEYCPADASFVVFLGRVREAISTKRGSKVEAMASGTGEKIGAYP